MFQHFIYIECRPASIGRTELRRKHEKCFPFPIPEESHGVSVFYITGNADVQQIGQFSGAVAPFTNSMQENDQWIFYRRVIVVINRLVFIEAYEYAIGSGHSACDLLCPCIQCTGSAEQQHNICLPPVVGADLHRTVFRIQDWMELKTKRRKLEIIERGKN